MFGNQGFDTKHSLYSRHFALVQLRHWRRKALSDLVLSATISFLSICVVIAGQLLSFEKAAYFALGSLVGHSIAFHGLIFRSFMPIPEELQQTDTVRYQSKAA
jgi:hypothetical protein